MRPRPAPRYKPGLAAAAPLFLAVLLPAYTLQPAIGMADELAQRGRIIADTYCARCHATDATGDSPMAEAPPLRSFKQRWPVENLAEALAEGIMVGHEAMPEFQMTPSEIDAFLAYLESF